MKVNTLTKAEFIQLFYSSTEEFMKRIHEPEVFVVKEFYPANEILALRERTFRAGQSSEPSWHPLKEGCPDYHRLHDNYEKAYVKGKIHTFYHHGYLEKNAPLFDYFREIFEMKNHLAGFAGGGNITNRPLDGLVARVNLHHYPKGGGYQAEHIDPAGRHARIQTLVQASRLGEDFQRGGLFARETPTSERFYIDRFTGPGDFMVLSPAIQHGVDTVDPEDVLDWNSNNGRWIILPIFVYSDYPHPENVKPAQVG